MSCCLAILSNGLIPESSRFNCFFRCALGPVRFDLNLAQQLLNVKTMSIWLSSLGLVGPSLSLVLVVDFFSVSCSRPNLPNRLMVSIVQPPLSSFFVWVLQTYWDLNRQVSRNLLQHLSSWLVPNPICLYHYPRSFLSSEWGFRKWWVSFVWSESVVRWLV